MTDWIIDRTARTVTHRPSRMIMDVVRERPGGAEMHARHETVQGMAATLVERLMVEGKAAYRAGIASGS